MHSYISKYKNSPAALKAAIWFTICSFLQKGISFITVPLFTRLLSTEQYGLFNVYYSWLGIISTFATLQLTFGVFNVGMVKFENDRNRFLSSLQGLTTVTTLVCFLMYISFYNFWNNLFGLSTILMVVMFTQLLLAPALGFWSARQRFDYKYRALVLVTLVIAILTPCLGVIAVISTEYKAEARIISVAFVEIAIGVFLYIYNMSKGKVFFNKRYWKYALAFNIPLIPHYLSQTLLGQSDRIMINKMIGANEVGIYSLAYSVAMIMTLINTSINSTFNPWTYKKLKSKSYKEIGKVTNYLLLLIATMSLTLSLVAPELIQIFAPREYYEAIWIIPSVAASVYFMFLYSLFANVEFYYEKNKFIMVASIVGAALNILLNYLFIPIFGFVAAGYTTLICYITFSFLHYVFMRRICIREIKGENIYNNKFIFILSTFLVSASILITYLYNFQYLRYLLLLVIFTILMIRFKSIITFFKDMSR